MNRNTSGTAQVDKQDIIFQCGTLSNISSDYGSSRPARHPHQVVLNHQWDSTYLGANPQKA